MWGTEYTVSVSSTDTFITKNVAGSLILKDEDLKDLQDLQDLNVKGKNQEQDNNKHWLSVFIVYLSSWLKVEEEGQLNTTTTFQDDLASGQVTKKQLKSVEEDSEDSEEQVTTDTTDIWVQWEWVIGKTEEALMKKDQQNSEDLKNELNQLRNRANRLKTKPRFFEESKSAFNEISYDDIFLLQSNILDSSKRSKIISDIISHCSCSWLDFIRLAFFIDDDDNFLIYKEGIWDQDHYKKGVVGGLKEVGWKASHGNGKQGLTSIVLCDILWSFWNSLCFSICSVIDRSLTIEEQESVGSKVCECKLELIKLWISTTKNSLLGTSLAGQVVQKWKENENQQRRIQLETIKRMGSDLAKYEYKKTVISAAERKPIGDLKKMLEAQLVFK